MSIALERRRYMGAKRYDAQVEYLVFSGNEWINTRIYGSLSTSFVIEFQPHENFVFVFGSRTSATTGNIGLFIGNRTNVSEAVIVDFGNYNTTRTSLACTSGNWYRAYNSSSGRYISDLTSSSSIESTTSYNADFSTPTPLYLGYRSDYFPSSLSNFKGYVRSLTLYENETIIQDLIPVRVGDVGYMYDNVTGELFGDEGGGAFTYGADV